MLLGKNCSTNKASISCIAEIESETIILNWPQTVIKIMPIFQLQKNKYTFGNEKKFKIKLSEGAEYELNFVQTGLQRHL